MVAGTAIGWTHTRLDRDLVIHEDARIDGDVVLRRGTYPAGSMLPGMTFNPWIGCQKISRACERCYAETLVTGRMGYNPTSSDPKRRLRVWGPPATSTRVRTSPANWAKPVRWNKVAADLGVSFKVFCASLADVGEDNATVRDWRAELFALIDTTPRLKWLLLTKRPHILARDWPQAWRRVTPRNVWVGATVEDQASADERIPALLTINARVHWLSCEPLAGPINLARPGDHWLNPDHHDRAALLQRNGRWGTCSGCPRDAKGMPCPERCAFTDRHDHHLRGLSWIVIGGESGSGHATLNLGHVESLVAQATAAKVATFVKQDSGALPGRQGRLSDALWSLKQWPAVEP